MSSGEMREIHLPRRRRQEPARSREAAARITLPAGPRSTPDGPPGCPGAPSEITGGYPLDLLARIAQEPPDAGKANLLARPATDEIGVPQPVVVLPDHGIDFEAGLGRSQGADVIAGRP